MNCNLVLQKLAPHQLLSRIAGKLAQIEQPVLKNQFIKWLMQLYPIDLSEAVIQDPEAYKNFNDFFLRKLQSNKRPITQQANAIASPVDGFVSQFGAIEKDRLIQAKGKNFNLLDLFAADREASLKFSRGSFMTLYLAPQNYHWVHMPIDGQLTAMTYVPGKLFSVNPLTLNNMENVFASNERVICLFETAVGPMAMILVGAMLVGSINTVWHGDVNPKHPKQIQQWHYPNPQAPTPKLNRGEPMGHFKMGSTVILVFAENHLQWQQQLQCDSAVKYGEKIATSTTVPRTSSVDI